MEKPKPGKIELSESSWVPAVDPFEQPGRLSAYGAERYAMVAVIAVVLVAIVVFALLFMNQCSFPRNTVLN